MGDIMSTENKPFVIRLRPDTRALLDAAALDQRRSRASVIDETLRKVLTERYSSAAQRVNQLLAGKA
jgi:uncharacterized protein (DUF1778 family)